MPDKDIDTYRDKNYKYWEPIINLENSKTKNVTKIVYYIKLKKNEKIT